MLSLAESLLPGARFLRPVLFSGALWLLGGWLFISDEIPDPKVAEGFASQAYAVVRYFGPFGAAAIVVIAAFVVGTLAAPIASLPAGVVRKVRSWITTWRAGVAHLRKVKAESEVKIRRANERVTQLDLRDSDDDKSKRAREQLLAEIAGHTALLNQFKPWTPFFPTRALRTRLGLKSPPRDHRREREFLNSHIADGAAQYLDSIGFTEYRSIMEVASFSDDELVARLRRELAPDPLDLVYALDEQLFLELDRERSERNVRAAVSLPIVAIGIFISITWAPWSLIIAGLALLLFVQNTVASAAEIDRVLHQMHARSLLPPSAKTARAQGRDDAFMFVRDKAERERIKQEGRERMEQDERVAG